MKPIDQPKAQRSRSSRRQRFQARLEALEGRALLATLYVNAAGAAGGDGSQAHPFSTIQAAINQSLAGDTVSIAAGTYAESLSISHPLTLLGPNAGINPNTGTRGAEAMIVPPATSTPSSGALIAVSASNVTIDGLALDGQMNAASGITNVDPKTQTLASISGLNVRNDVIQNLTAFGVIADVNDFSGPTLYVSTGNSIVNNKIDNIPTVSPTPGRGISIEDNFYADVEGNVITRTGTGIQSIQTLSPGTAGAVSTISNNQIHDYLYGIYLWNLDTDAPTANVTNNTIVTESSPNTAATNAGIKVQLVLHATSITLANNNISGAYYGYDLQALTTSNTVTVTGGTLTGNAYGVELSNSALTSSGPPLAPVSANLAGVTIRNSTIAGLLVADTHGVAADPVTLGVDAATTVAGSPHGVVLTGTAAHLTDAASPSVSLTATPPAQTSDTTTTFSFTTTDNVTSANDLAVSYSLDGATAAPATSPISLYGLSLGSHTLVVTATDQAGDSGSASFTWKVVAPTPNAPSAPTLDPGSDHGISSTDGITNDNTPTFNGTAAAGSVVNLYAGATLIGTATATPAGAWSLTVGGTGSTVATLADGVYAVTATTTVGGQTSAASTATMITIDTAAPTLKASVSGQPNAAGWYNANVAASYTASDSLSGLASASSGNFTFTSDGRGQTHTFTVTDVAGNSASVTVGPVNIDKTAPVVTLSATPGTLSSPNGQPVTLTVSGKATDSLSGIAGATISIRDSGGTVNIQAPLTLASDGSFSYQTPISAAQLQQAHPGKLTITVTAKDAAGNQQQASTTVTIPQAGGAKGQGGDQDKGHGDGDGSDKGHGDGDGSDKGHCQDDKGPGSDQSHGGPQGLLGWLARLGAGCNNNGGPPPVGSFNLSSLLASLTSWLKTAG